MRIGRDHVASTVNTLALAYAGAALPLLILLVQSHQSLGTVANSETIAVEIVRTLVGSIGLVASVPLTTWLAARVVTGQTSRRGSRRPERPRATGGPAEPTSRSWRRSRSSGAGGGATTSSRRRFLLRIPLPTTPLLTAPVEPRDRARLTSAPSREASACGRRAGLL